MKKKFLDMKVQPKLILSFVIVVAIASLAGVLGSILLLITDNSYSEALVVNGFAQGDIGRYNASLNRGGALVRDIILLTDEAEIAEAQQELAETTKQTDEALAAIKVNCNTPKELEYIATMESNLPKYREARERVAELGLQNKNEEAMALFRSEAKPYLDTVLTAAEALQDLNVTMGEEVSTSLTRNSRITVAFIVIVVIVSILISVCFAIFVAKSIARPIVKVMEASEKLARGELDIAIEAESEDEVGQMTVAFSKATGLMRHYIEELGRGLKEMADGNFDIDSNVQFLGDFKALDNAIRTIIVSMNGTLHQINEASGQVALGAGQMAESAQSLAEGATEQAGAVEELTATIQDVTSMVEMSAEKTKAAYEQAMEFEKEAQGSNTEIRQLTEAMMRISETSGEIQKIIAEIEDIASQTNLLSLNASIEAARAGEAGRGFAVVADQIGKLASDSAQSAVNTRELIIKSIQEVENGSAITEKTTESIQKVIGGIEQLASSSKESSEMSKSQAETMRQIEAGVTQISTVVQSNSAAAQETSATSEELSAQSDNLRDLVERFRLKQSIDKEFYPS